MFLSCTKNFSIIDPQKNPVELNILVCGVHNAGKTTTIRRLMHLGVDVIPNEPTYGRKDYFLNYKFNFEVENSLLEKNRTFYAETGGGNEPESPNHTQISGPVSKPLTESKPGKTKYKQITLRNF